MNTSSFALLDEMRAAPDILRRFDPTIISPWLATIQQHKKLLLTGEGSSRIFPAHNLIARSLHQRTDWTIHTSGAREAVDYDLSDFVVIGASNSGQTRELIDLFTILQQRAIPHYGLTATSDSALTRISDHSLVLSCGREQAIAATKSVFEQALVYQSLLQGPEWEQRVKAADLCQAILNQTPPAIIVDHLTSAPHVYIAGRNDGVAEELTLKATEIIRQKATYLEGTYLQHGIEETLQPGDTILLIEPFPADCERIRDRLEDGIGVHIIAIAAEQTLFPTFIIPSLPGFDSYFQLLAGWNLLSAAGLRKGIDLDHPKRARKSGNAI